jgi:hypothetical protein
MCARLKVVLAINFQLTGEPDALISPQGRGINHELT